MDRYLLLFAVVCLVWAPLTWLLGAAFQRVMRPGWRRGAITFALRAMALLTLTAGMFGLILFR